MISKKGSQEQLNIQAGEQRYTQMCFVTLIKEI